MKTFQNTLKNIFYNSPSWIQSLYGSLPVSIKFGKTYVDELNLINKSYHWNQQQLDDFLNFKIISTVNLAYLNVPFYRNLYNLYGINISQIQNINDMKELPIVTKSSLVNSNDVVKNNKAGSLNSYIANTGGSSGTPFSFLIPKNHYYRAWAYKGDMWGRAGYSIGDPILSFRGHNFDKSIYKHQPLYNFYYVDSYKLNSKSITDLVELIRNKGIKFLHGFPSNLIRFYELIKGRFSLNIAGIFPCSEMLDIYKKNILISYFNSRILPSYEQSEMTILASYGWRSDKYYFYPTYGYPEIVEEGSDQTITDCGIVGKMIGTTFDNPLMPLIRYETGDEAFWAIGDETRLQNFRCVGKIYGRVGEYIEVDDQRVSITGLIYGHHLPIFDVSTRIQIYKAEEVFILFYVSDNVGDNYYNFENKTKIILQDSLNNKIKVLIQQIDEPFKTNSGKMKILLDSIPNVDKYIK